MQNKSKIEQAIQEHGSIQTFLDEMSDNDQIDVQLASDLDEKMDKLLYLLTAVREEQQKGTPVHD